MAQLVKCPANIKMTVPSLEPHKIVAAQFVIPDSLGSPSERPCLKSRWFLRRPLASTPVYKQDTHSSIHVHTYLYTHMYTLNGS